MIFIPTIEKIAQIKGWSKLTKPLDKRIWTEKQSNNPFKRSPKPETAVLTGIQNDIFFLDIDIPQKKDMAKGFDDGLRIYNELLYKYNNGKPLKTPTFRTRNGGIQVGFKYDKEIRTTTKLNKSTIDIRSDGAYSCCPPTQSYTWIYGDFKNTFMKCPKWLKEWILKDNDDNEDEDEPISNRVRPKYVNNHDIFITCKDDDLIDRLNRLPMKYCDDFTKWMKILAICKSLIHESNGDEIYKIFDEWSKKSSSYNKSENKKIWNKITPMSNLFTFNKILKKVKVPLITFNITKKLKIFTHPCDEQVNSRYVNYDNFDRIKDRAFLIKSNTGTGKTFCTNNFTEKINIRKGYKLLSIVSRRTLADQHMESFKSHNMKHYERNKQQINTCDSLVVQIDSLLKLDLDVWKNCILVLDEFHSLLCYLLSSNTIKDKDRYWLLTALKYIMSNASSIIGLDADMSDLCVFFMKKIGLNPYIYMNKYIQNKTKTTEYLSEDVIIRDIKKRLKQKTDLDTIVICFDSLREEKLIHKELYNYCKDNELKHLLKRIVRYSSENGRSEDFKNLKKKWIGKIVFYTPSIIYGLDFNNINNTYVYLIAQCNSINALEFNQQVCRTRNIAELKYFVAPKEISLKYFTRKKLRESYDNLIKNCKKLFKNKMKKIIESSGGVFNPIDKSWKINDDFFCDLFSYYEWYESILKSNPKLQFRWLLMSKGFDIKYNKEKAEDTVNRKKLKIEIKEERDEMVNKIIDGEEQLNEQAKILKEKAEKRCEYLNLDIDNETHVKKFQEYIFNDAKLVEHLRMMNFAYKDEFNIKKLSSSDVYSILKYRSSVTKALLIKKLKKELNISYNVDTKEYMKRFDEKVKVPKRLKKSIINIFNYKIKKNTFKEWYYIYIKMLKTIDKNILSSSRKKISGTYYSLFTLNENVIKKHIDLFSYRGDLTKLWIPIGDQKDNRESSIEKIMEQCQF